jgi:hypothetical protein
VSKKTVFKKLGKKQVLSLHEHKKIRPFANRKKAIERRAIWSPSPFVQLERISIQPRGFSSKHTLPRNNNHF